MVDRLNPSRPCTWPFSRPSVTQTSIVRSNGSLPAWTFESMSTARSKMNIAPNTSRRYCFRVMSIRLATEIS